MGSRHIGGVLASTGAANANKAKNATKLPILIGLLHLAFYWICDHSKVNIVQSANKLTGWKYSD